MDSMLGVPFSPFPRERIKWKPDFPNFAGFVRFVVQFSATKKSTA